MNSPSRIAAGNPIAVYAVALCTFLDDARGGSVGKQKARLRLGCDAPHAKEEREYRGQGHS